MNRRILVIIAGVVCVMLMATLANAGLIFVATAKNLRGALYLGAGPTPKHAAEIAIVKCSQDTVIPSTCKVCRMRQEMIPDEPLKKTKVRKYRKVGKTHYPIQRQHWGRSSQ